MQQLTRAVYSALRTAHSSSSSRPAARSYRQKAEILAGFKESNARSATFFLVCVGMEFVTCKQ
jgi:hypothetical protein